MYISIRKKRHAKIKQNKHTTKSKQTSIDPTYGKNVKESKQSNAKQKCHDQCTYKRLKEFVSFTFDKEWA